VGKKNISGLRLKTLPSGNERNELEVLFSTKLQVQLNKLEANLTAQFQIHYTFTDRLQKTWMSATLFSLDDVAISDSFLLLNPRACDNVRSNMFCSKTACVNL